MLLRLQPSVHDEGTTTLSLGSISYIYFSIFYFSLFPL